MFDQAAIAEPLREVMPRRFSIVRPSMARNGDLAAAARARVASSTYRGVRSVSCECHNGVLVLRGWVSSFHQKQMAQEAVRNLPGIREVVNFVQVVQPNART